jgi:hypothetical protein
MWSEVKENESNIRHRLRAREVTPASANVTSDDPESWRFHFRIPKLFRLCDRCHRPYVLPLDWRLLACVLMVVCERKRITPNAVDHDFALLQRAAIRPRVPCNMARFMKSLVI